MTSVRKAYIDTPLGQIHYRYTEPETENAKVLKLPILFLHMSASSSASCSLLMDMFALLGYSSFAPDMSGFGQSFDPKISAFRKGCHLVDHHSGGVIGTQLAVSHPELIHSLTIVGPALLSYKERDAMRQFYLAPFNRPVTDGSHLLKTWDYVSANDKQTPRVEIQLLQRETLDHIRAWKGRSQIYSCVWDYDGIVDFRKVSIPMLALCARDDVLWPYFHYVKALRPDVQSEEIAGSNFGLDRGAESIKLFLIEFLQACT